MLVGARAQNATEPGQRYVVRPRNLWSILKGTGENWLDDQASSISAALAFYCAFSLAPLLIIIVTIAGWVVGGDVA